MRAQRELRCLIAAGGTAGHVLPALAVADALRERGVHVTFAGSPDRAEAQLVPEAGYELDTFRVTGLPRRPSVALARSLLLAGAAPRACRRILRARRPDVVLVARLRNQPRFDAIRRPGERHVNAALRQRVRDRDRRQDVTGRPPGCDQAPKLPLHRHAERC